MSNLQEITSPTIEEVNKLKKEAEEKINGIIYEFEKKTGTFISDINLKPTVKSEFFAGDEREEGLIMVSLVSATVSLKVNL